MPVLFVAIKPPSDVALHLSLLQGGIPGARWEAQEKLHLTLRYLGDVDAGTMRRVTAALGQLEGVAPFTLTLTGVGTFPPRGLPRSVWIGVEDPAPLIELHRHIERVVCSVDGIAPDPRKFAPHLTLGRLKDAPPVKVADFLAYHALVRCAPFVVDRVFLMSSVRSASGSSYRIESGTSLG